MSTARTALLVLLAASAAAGVWLGSRWYGADEVEAPEIGGYLLQPPRALPAFELVDGKGSIFRTADFEGEWSFLYFGYTYCPDVCPLSLVELAKVKELLDAARPNVPTAYYLVSVDPERDTAERIGEYVAYFDPEFRGLTGALAEIDKLARAASVLYAIPDERDGAYLVGHSSSITLLNPEGQIHAIYTSPFEPARIAADFDAILKHHRAAHPR